MDDSKPLPEFTAKLERVYFVYDPGSGEVLGAHAVSTARGGKLPKDTELEQMIRSDAVKRFGGKATTFKLAFLSGPEFDPARNYRFDKRSKRLVASPRSGAGRAARDQGASPVAKPPAAPAQIRF